MSGRAAASNQLLHLTGPARQSKEAAQTEIL